MHEQDLSSSTPVPSPTTPTSPASTPVPAHAEHASAQPYAASTTQTEPTQVFPEPRIRVISTKHHSTQADDLDSFDVEDFDNLSSEESIDNPVVSGSVYVKHKKQRGCGWLLGVIIMVIIGAALGTLGTLYGLTSPQGQELLAKLHLPGLELNKQQESAAPLEAPVTSSGDGVADADRSEQVAAQAMPSVARISTVTKKGSAVGSGVVYDKDGHILTNYHVISDAQSVSVHLDGKTYKAEILGDDPETDLAVLKVDAHDLKPLARADSDKIKVGEWVMAIGSPFGLDSTVTTGIVSSPQRSTTMPSAAGVTIYASLIQTDAAINMGNSGGALVNKRGELVGINTLIYSNSGSSAGIGFAIPSNYAAQIADQIIAGKPVEHTYLGVSMTTVSIRDASKFDGQSSAAMVEDVEADAAAGKAGLQKGDVILAFNGEAISSADDLVLKVRRAKAGDKVTLKVYRDKVMDVEVTLGSKASKSQTQNFQREESPQGEFLPFPSPNQPHDNQGQNGHDDQPSNNNAPAH